MCLTRILEYCNIAHVALQCTVVLLLLFVIVVLDGLRLVRTYCVRLWLMGTASVWADCGSSIRMQMTNVLAIMCASNLTHVVCFYSFGRDVLSYMGVQIILSTYTGA